MDEQQTTIAADHGAVASPRAGTTDTSTTVLGTATPEFFKICESCRLAFREYEPLNGRIFQFCPFCGSRLSRAMSSENRVPPSNVQSPHLASVVDTSIDQRPSPPPSQVESSNIGQRSNAYPSLGFSRGSSPADERSDALNRSSQGRGITWTVPEPSTSPSVQSSNEPNVEPELDRVAQALSTFLGTLPSTSLVAQPAGGPVSPPCHPAISSIVAYHRQILLPQLPKYDFTRWHAYEVVLPAKPARVRARARSPRSNPMMERRSMTQFQRTSIPKKVKKLEKRAEKLRQQIRAKEAVKAMAGAELKGQGDTQRQTESTVEER